MNRSIKIIAEKGFVPIKENNCLYYFEVKIIPEIEEKCGWSAEIGLFKNNSQQFRVCSNGLFCSKTNLNSPYKQSQMFGCLIKSNDIIGCGIYFPKLNNENKESLNAQLFFTINGEKKGKTIFLDLNDSENSFQYFPSASLFCCSVEANFGTNKFLYKIDEYKNE
uniref:SPRY domain-containing protein n=1 Tax=Meloidogyne hapla TaxID=6305 RepID=A0A1I8B1I0_MELHA